MNKVKTRLMNREDDYKRIGVKPNIIEAWEDGRRDDSRPGAYEWWYFDMLLDDGTKVVICFHDKFPGTPAAPLTPYVEFEVTMPNGEFFHEDYAVGAEEATFSREGCDIRFGQLHSLTGDLKRYEIKVSTVGSIGADLVLESMSSPWRPGTGYTAFGNEDEDYFTWLCSIPRGRVHGQLTVNGETCDVSGFGYHDHQWGNAPTLMVWNHWFWIRQAFEDYTILVFDLVASEKYGYARYPLMFVQDAEGNIVFESIGDIEETKLEVHSEYEEKVTGKTVPKAFTYTFRDGNKSVVYTMEATQDLAMFDTYNMGTPEVQAIFDQAKIRPTYHRWAGRGQLEVDLDGVTSRHEGDALYEMIFSGTKYQE